MNRARTVREASGFHISIYSESLPGIPEVGDVHHFPRIELEVDGIIIAATITPERLEALRDVIARVQVERNAASVRMKKLLNKAEPRS